MKRITITGITLLMLLALAIPALAQPVFPDEIALPTGFAGEGIEIGVNQTFYAGSLANGDIVQGNLRTGEVELLAEGTPGVPAVGMSFDPRSRYLFVGGGPAGVGRVYDTQTGDMLAEYEMTSGPNNFINDVVVTREAAYFTNSFAPYFYVVPLGSRGELPDPADVQSVELTGDWSQPSGFGANGIEASANGKTLVIVSSGDAAVFAVNPQTGVASEIDLDGESLPNGDGLVLLGRTLYVVQNQLNQIGVVTLSPDLSSGTVGEPITSPAFAVPTTAAPFGSSLYAVNAKFGTSPEGTPYEVVKVSR